ncbi:hypothetical protein V2G26_011065 [Clonostachys chloroleuca]
MGRNGTGDTEQKSILENYTSWKYFSNGHKWLCRLDEQGLDGKDSLHWQAQALLRPCLNGSNRFNHVLDTGKPHVNCFIADKEPLREDCLSTMFSVTIVSACMFNVRIVQAIIRLGSNTVEIRKSDILDLSPGLTDEATQDRFRRLLAWLLGTPIGNVTTKS